MIIARTRYALKHASDVFRKEGIIPSVKLLAQDTFRFLGHYVFRCSHFYLYEYTMKKRDEADFLPKIDNFTVYRVSSNHQADMLAARGVDFRECFFNSREALDKGAIAFCIFVGGEFAHIGWVALTEEAKNTFDAIPYPVDFRNNEACTGGTLTLPKFRGKGLMKYGYFLRFQFLREKGVRVSRNAVNADNRISQRVHAKFKPRVCGELRYLRVLKWKFRKRICLFK